MVKGVSEINPPGCFNPVRLSMFNNSVGTIHTYAHLYLVACECLVLYQ